MNDETPKTGHAAPRTESEFEESPDSARNAVGQPGDPEHPPVVPEATIEERLDQLERRVEKLQQSLKEEDDE